MTTLTTKVTELPYIRVDDELKMAIRRLQGFLRLTHGTALTEGETIKEVLKGAVFELRGEGLIEIVTYPFDKFQTKQKARKSNAVDTRRVDYSKRTL